MPNADSSFAACRRCGCPLAGNESYCSHCGLRIDGRGRPWMARGLAIATVLVLLAAAGTCVARHTRGAASTRSSVTEKPSEIDISNRIETARSKREMT
jgi:hypothetical protein